MSEYCSIFRPCQANLLSPSLATLYLRGGFLEPGVGVEQCNFDTGLIKGLTGPDGADLGEVGTSCC